MSSDHAFTVGSLFSGAGLMDWGLTLAGFEHAWFCESDEFCRNILGRRYPGAPIYEDIRTIEAPERVTVLAGGFPCQDLSAAGRRAGIAGKRSGLWFHFARLVGDLRPDYVLVENVPGLLSGGMGRVLGDLAESGYDAEWDCLPAAAFGAPHLRARIFVLAYPSGTGRSQDGLSAGWNSSRSGSSPLADAQGEPIWAGLRSSGPASERRGRFGDGSRSGGAGWWASEPDVGRVAHGVSTRVDRLRALGNGVVPQIAKWIGERILEREAMR